MKFEDVEVSNFKGAFRGLRNPLASHHLSDSYERRDREVNNFVIGEKDMDLAHRMIKGGSEESKFLRQIGVSVDITAPRYFWQEYDTYHVGTTANSYSTMHKLSYYPITVDMFAIDENDTESTYWQIVINHLESLRKKYIESKDYKWFRLLKQELPESFLQKRTLTLNYAVLRAMVKQRMHHRLSEWSADFINWVHTLPYADALIFYGLGD